jgi:hypothetical protein
VGWIEAMWYRFHFQAGTQSCVCGVRKTHRWGLSSPTVCHLLKNVFILRVDLAYKLVHEPIDTGFLRPGRPCIDNSVVPSFASASGPKHVTVWVRISKFHVVSIRTVPVQLSYTCL